MDREVLAYLMEVLTGEPITLEQLSYQLMETFPHFVLSATGLIHEMCPMGSTFSECVAACIAVCSNLPANRLETPYFFEEDDVEDEIEGDSGNEMPQEWGTDDEWPCVWIDEVQKPIELGETIIFSDLDSVPHPGEGRYWAPGKYRDSFVLRFGKPKARRAWLMRNRGMRPMFGDEPADLKLRRALSDRPSSSVTFPDTDGAPSNGLP